ncbi:integrase [Rhizobium laguerreae]|uniref:Integrase n=1 Tax=Rhizobium laguerreae TaxID=1076926 RepID=A0ABR6GBC9_9HYPH|nr:integrase [Rhizobium laguerreae]
MHTVASYRDTFKLFLRFAHRKTGKPPSSLMLEDFDAELVIAFLDDLTAERRVGTTTYNLRLTAIRAFFRFLAFEEPAFSHQIQRVLAIPGKIGAKREVQFLVRDEIKALLAAPDKRSWVGRRDYCLLLTAIQTGMRLSELVGLDRGAVTLDAGIFDASERVGRSVLRRSPNFCALCLNNGWTSQDWAIPTSSSRPCMDLG